MAEVARLSAHERQRLAGLLAKMEVENDVGFWQEIQRRADDRNPDYWISLEDLKRAE